MKIKLFVIILILISVLSACANQERSQPITDPTNLSQLENARQGPTLSDNESNLGLGQIRGKALEDTAMSLGAQGGLAWASEQTNCRLEKDRWYLETVYNFNGMMLSHGVIPPVLEQGDFSLNLADPNTIRVADKTYKIIQQARFATTPPNWREYLWMSYPKPEIPSKFLLPRNEKEGLVWRCAVQTGWNKGVQQAASIFQENLARLKRDYQGMILYRKLLEEHKISAPFVSRTELGVTGDGSNMRVNDQVLRITELPQLQTDSSNWKAIVVPQ